MWPSLKAYVKRKQIMAAKERHIALANFKAAIDRKDTRKQHELERAALEATNRALRMGV